MSAPTLRFREPRFSCLRLFLTGLLLGLVCLASGTRVIAADGGGMIIGTVSSAATRNMLQGATIHLPAQNRNVVTDNTGRFVIRDLPPGAVELVVSYAGFEEQRQTAMVSGGQSSTLNVELRAANLVVLEKITVAGEREGNALALTQQRNADNFKNVIAMDAFGPVTFMNV